MTASSAVILDDKRIRQDQLELQDLVDQLVPLMRALQWPEAVRVEVKGPRGDSARMRRRYSERKPRAQKDTTRMAWMLTLAPSRDDVFESTEVGITTEGETVEAWIESFYGAIMPVSRLGQPNTCSQSRWVRELTVFVRALLAKYGDNA